jgi:hypothetical protein
MQLIDKAIELLQEHGWIRYAAHTENGFCVMGAMMRAACMTQSSGRDLHDAYEALGRVITPGYGSIGPAQLILHFWNDDPHLGPRDADEVIEKLKLAGERLDLEAERKGLSCS